MSEKYCETLFNYSKIGILEIELQGETDPCNAPIVDCSHGLEKIMHSSKAALCHRTLKELWTEYLADDSDWLTENFKDFSDPLSNNTSFYSTKLDKCLNFHAFENEAGQFSLLIMDTSHHCAKQEELKNELLQTVNYEIRTALCDIIGFTDLLRQTALDESQQDYAKNANSSGRQLLQFIDSKISDSLNSSDLPPFKPEDFVHDIETNKLDMTVLLAEDNEINLLVSKAMLFRHIDVDKVYTATNGQDAARKYLQLKPDLILMDVQMPVADGLTATQKIRQYEADKGLHTPIVALTAGASKEEMERCLDAGMDAFLPKPVNKDRLLKILRRYAVKRSNGKQTTEADTDIS